MYLLQDLRAEPRQDLDAEFGEIVNYFKTLAVSDHAQIAAQAGEVHLSICRNQHMTGLHTPACKEDREKAATDPPSQVSETLAHICIPTAWQQMI